MLRKAMCGKGIGTPRNPALRHLARKITMLMRASLKDDKDYYGTINSFLLDKGGRRVMVDIFVMWGNILVGMPLHL